LVSWWNQTNGEFKMSKNKEKRVSTTIRINPTLLAALKELAKKDDRSVNSYIMKILSLHA
jgi:hypothetical protein